MFPLPRIFALRWKVVSSLACVVLAGCVSSLEPQAPNTSAADAAWLAGADVSALPVFESRGACYSAKGRSGDALEILRDAGVNCFRVRLFVAPDGEGIVTNDLDYTVRLAKRIKAAGAKLLLDIHYSDTWADPGKQFKPAAWENLGFDELVEKVGSYTREVLARFAAEGATPDIVQIGNEITNGLLWPDGRVEYAERERDAETWPKLARLLRAGLEAVPTGPGAPQRMIHIECTGNLPRTRWYLNHLRAENLHFDLLGLSYYPEWHGTLADLRETLSGIAEEFRLPVVVVETAYPWKHDEHFDGKENLVFPFTPAGQKAFLADVAAAVRATPHGLGRGVVYWHPEVVPVRDLNIWIGGSCALFDERGELLPAAAALR